MEMEVVVGGLETPMLPTSRLPRDLWSLPSPVASPLP